MTGFRCIFASFPSQDLPAQIYFILIEFIIGIAAQSRFEHLQCAGDIVILGKVDAEHIVCGWQIGILFEGITQTGEGLQPFVGEVEKVEMAEIEQRIGIGRIAGDGTGITQTGLVDFSVSFGDGTEHIIEPLRVVDSGFSDEQEMFGIFPISQTVVCFTLDGSGFSVTGNGWVSNGENDDSGEQKQIIITVCRRAEALQLRRAVRKIDPSAFIIVTKTSEIMGKGFRG